MPKILLIVAVVLSVLTAGIGFLNKTKIDDARSTAEGLQAQLDTTSKELDTTKASLSKSQEELAAATSEKEALGKQLTAAKSDAEQAKSQASQAQEQLKDKETQLAQLQSDITAKDTKIAELEAASAGSTAAAETVDNSAETEAKLAEQDALIQKLQADLTASQSQARELQVEKQNRANQVMRSGLEGRILAVNPAWNFVVLSLGDRQGVVNNAEMLVKRGTQLIGKVRITSVEPATSIADIVANSVPRGLSIQPGDNVIYVSGLE